MQCNSKFDWHRNLNHFYHYPILKTDKDDIDGSKEVPGKNETITTTSSPKDGGDEQDKATTEPNNLAIKSRPSSFLIIVIILPCIFLFKV